MPEARDGQVVQVSLSGGGLPKTPVERAWVGRLGLVGDRQASDTVHGGPLRAVCLFGLEAIERVRAEGHPLVPGAAGENITTRGIEWSRLPPGTRVCIGEDLLLELTWASMPCHKQRPNFRDGLISRISIVRHPDDSRMYARVLHEGEVRPGDAVRLLPPDPTSDADRLAVLTRQEKATAAGWLALWRGAARAGFDVRVIDDGDLVAAASADLVAPAFNRWATGARTVPHLAWRVRDLFSAAGAAGVLEGEESPAGPVDRADLLIMAATPTEMEATAADGAGGPWAAPTVRTASPRECACLVASAGVAARHRGGPMEPTGDLGPETVEAILASLPAGGTHRLVAVEEAGRLLASGMLVTHRRVGSLVLAGSGDRGTARPELGPLVALARSMARVAQEAGCDLVVAEAGDGSPWHVALAMAGLKELRRARTWLFVPGRTAPGEAPAPGAAARAGVGP